jgi:RNA polymerase sigma-70 factor, ECF subfamily
MSQLPTSPRQVAEPLDDAWREHRRYVLDVALHMLGDLAEAEDVVQEAFIRLLRNGVDEIDDVRAWLVTVVSRLCLDQLRSARRQRQQPLETETLPTPGSTARVTASPAGVDPADRVTLDDSVRLALQVMLERLTPAERTAFVLHDVFQLSFDDVARIVGRSTEASRQLASRARQHLRGDATRFDIESDEQRLVAQVFIAAASTGDLDALLAVLAPDVHGEADLGGGKRGGFSGRDRVAAGLLRYIGPDSGIVLLSLPTAPEPTVLGVSDGEVVMAATLSVRDGRIAEIRGILDPERLAPITAALSRD